MQLVMWKYYRHKNNLQLDFINLVEYTECRQATYLEREKRKVEEGKRERTEKERGRRWGRAGKRWDRSINKRERKSTCPQGCTEVLLPCVLSRRDAILYLFFAQYILVMQMEWQPLVLMPSLSRFYTASFPLQSSEREPGNLPKEAKPIANVVSLEACSALHEKTAPTTRNYPASLRFSGLPCLPLLPHISSSGR